jgi:hypothetical protein
VKIRYVNYKKEFPASRGWKRRLTVSRYSSGKLWNIGFNGRAIVVDFRTGWKDMMGVDV